MNSTLLQSARQADGRYFTDAELKPLERYVQTYAVRLETYSILREKGDELVLLALRKFAVIEGEMMRQHGDKCKRDMSYVVQVLALPLLQDDEGAFREQLTLLMQNILAEVHAERQSARAYQFLQQVVAEKMPAECAKLVNTYLEDLILSLKAGQ